MKLTELITSLDRLLEPGNYHDYAPNGLQVEGCAEVRKIVTGVTACLDLLQEARHRQADMVLVHHGWFWKHDDPRITGIRKARVAELLAGNMSLVGYHLPLDDNKELGNNTLLGKALGLPEGIAFGEDGLGRIASAASPMTCDELTHRITAELSRAPLVVGKTDRLLRRIAWCSGAAQDMIEEAAAAGADAFISGEISERTTHLARELGIAYFSCGHHATETFGIKALGEWLARKHGLEVEFINIDNPV